MLEWYLTVLPIYFIHGEKDRPFHQTFGSSGGWSLPKVLPARFVRIRKELLQLVGEGCKKEG
jgi:hypothetical protein